MSASRVNPALTDAEMLALGWPASVLDDLARQRAQLIGEMVMTLALTEPAWAPLRGETYAEQAAPGDELITAEEFVEAVTEASRTAAMTLSEYLALPAEPGDDDAALVASVAAEETVPAPAAEVQEPEPEQTPDPGETPEADPASVEPDEETLAKARARRARREVKRLMAIEEDF